MDNFLLNKCTLQAVDESIADICSNFDCEHSDINDFFHNHCVLYFKELLGKTYVFTLNEDPSTIVCAFTISNDSIKTINLPKSGKRRLTKKIPHTKHMRSYPAVLIGRLGVNKIFKHQNIGSELMDFIKSWFVNTNNKTGCRYILVDAYNEESPLKYYKKNQFTELFSSEEEERFYLNIRGHEKLRTRLLCFDLIVLNA